MINVYDKNETNFEHNGLVVLNACKSCYTIQELNGAYSLELEYPKDSREKYKYLEGWNIIKADGQLFRIPQISKLQDNGLSVEVTANHIFYDLLNDFNEDTRAENKTIEEALQIAITNTKFNILDSDLTNTNTAYFIRENPITSIFQKIIPRWGGELYRDNFNIAIKQRVGQDTGILISYGKNITGFEQTLDYSTIATRVMPVGKDELTIDLVNQGSKYLESPRINDYPFVITKELEFNDIEDATELKNKVLSLWGTIDIPSVNYKVNFIELSKTKEYERFSNLETVGIGDIVTIRHKEFGIDISARVIKIKKNVLTNKIEEIELGQFKENLTDVFYKLENKINYTNEVVQDVNEDLQGTKTIVFQNQEQISLKAQELQTNIDNTKTELQGNIDNTNSNVSTIDTRLSEAELKITPTAITSTVRVSTEYNADIQAAKDYADNAADTAETTAKTYADTQLNDFVSNIYNVDITEIQNQIDGNITTWFYDGEPALSNNPSVTWTTTDLKNNHLGDLYYDNVTGYAYRFRLNNSVYEWLKITDTDITKALADAAKAQDTADSKRRVFISTPVPPYDLGDLWSQGTTGDLMKCKVAKTQGQSYSSNDWEKASKYTDDSTVNNFVTNIYSIDKNSFQSQIDGKIETWFQTTDPNTWSVNDRSKHNGDIWFKSDTKALYRYNSTSNAWEQIQDQTAIDAYNNANNAQDTADSKRTVFTTTPTIPYYMGDLWLTSTSDKTGDLKKCITTRTTGSYTASDWVIATKYTDDTKANEALTNANNAQTTANNAVTSANTANDLLSDIANDNKLTPSEKQDTKKEWDIIVGEKPTIEAQAGAFEIVIEKTNYIDAYNSLDTYIKPLLSDLSATSDIVGTTFRGNFKNYYDAKISLLTAISNKAKILADNAQTSADNANTDISALTSVVTNVEEKITDESIINTVTKSEKYLEYSLVPNRVALTVTRNEATINPLSAYNYTSGSVVNANELIIIDISHELVYMADLQIADEDIVTFDKPNERILNAESVIEQNVDEINMRVKEVGDRVNTTESSIQVALDGLTLKTDKTVTDELGNLISQNSSSIEALTDAINFEVSRLEEDVNSVTDEMIIVKNHMTFDEDGLTISKSNSPFQITIDNDSMEFKDNDTVVAYVNGQKMYINSLEILNSAIIGVHKLEKYDANTTLIRWVG